MRRRGAVTAIVILAILLTTGCRPVPPPLPPAPSPTLTSIPAVTPTPTPLAITISGTVVLGRAVDAASRGEKVIYAIPQPVSRFGPTDPFRALITLSTSTCDPSILYGIYDALGHAAAFWQQQLTHPFQPCGASQIVASPAGNGTLGALLPPGTPAGRYMLVVNLAHASIAPAQFTYT